MRPSGLIWKKVGESGLEVSLGAQLNYGPLSRKRAGPPRREGPAEGAEPLSTADRGGVRPGALRPLPARKRSAPLPARDLAGVRGKTRRAPGDPPCEDEVPRAGQLLRPGRFDGRAGARPRAADPARHREIARRRRRDREHRSPRRLRPDCPLLPPGERGLLRRGLRRPFEAAELGPKPWETGDGRRKTFDPDTGRFWLPKSSNGWHPSAAGSSSMRRSAPAVTRRRFSKRSPESDSSGSTETPTRWRRPGAVSNVSEGASPSSAPTSRISPQRFQKASGPTGSWPTSASPQCRSTVRSAVSRFVATGRSTCGWGGKVKPLPTSFR